MILTKKIQNAINIAARLHREHERIGLDLPYIVHPYSVACILSRYTSDEDTICAGLLHDVLEDADGYSQEMMTRDFGPRVTAIVLEVTEDKAVELNQTLHDTWASRKRKYLEGIKIASVEAALVSAADTTHNLRSLIETYEKNGHTAWKYFSATIHKKAQFYCELAGILSARLEGSVVTELYAALAEFERVLSKAPSVQPVSFVGVGKLF